MVQMRMLKRQEKESFERKLEKQERVTQRGPKKEEKEEENLFCIAIASPRVQPNMYKKNKTFKSPQQQQQPLPMMTINFHFNGTMTERE